MTTSHWAPGFAALVVLVSGCAIDPTEPIPSASATVTPIAALPTPAASSATTATPSTSATPASAAPLADPCAPLTATITRIDYRDALDVGHPGSTYPFEIDYTVANHGTKAIRLYLVTFTVDLRPIDGRQAVGYLADAPDLLIDLPAYLNRVQQTGYALIEPGRQYSDDDFPASGDLALKTVGGNAPVTVKKVEWYYDDDDALNHGCGLK